MVLEYLIQNDNSIVMIVIGLVTIVAVVLVRKFLRFMKIFRYFESFPGDPSYSIFWGNLHKIPNTGEGRFAFIRYNMENRNPKYLRIWWGPFQANIGLYHPDTAKVILRSSAAPKSRGFGQVYEHAIPWIGEGLISSNGATWARSRRLLTPAFHFDILKPYVEVYNQAADTLFEKLDQLAESGESFDIIPIMHLCTLEIILKCAMSYDEDVQRKGHPYAQANKELQETWNTKSRTPWMWFDFIFRLTPSGRQFFKNCDYVHKVAEEVIAKRKVLLEKGGRPQGRHLDFLDILLTARDEDGNPMTTLEIRNEVDTFMFAGHDTTAAGACWILYALAKNPECQVKVQAEVDAIMKDKDSDNFEWSDLAKLHFLPISIKEAMRLYPPVPFIQRNLLEPIEIDGKTIPPGTNVTVSILHLHINPLVWDAPDEFRPERFLPENIKDKDSYCFTPFSAGPRNCIGQNFALNEEKVLISRILHRYDVELAPDAPAIERSATAILSSDTGIWFRLKRRQM